MFVGRLIWWLRKFSDCGGEVEMNGENGKRWEERSRVFLVFVIVSALYRWIN